jgi:hypothetical protein
MMATSSKGHGMAHEVFYWLPVDGARHAISGATGSHQPGQSIKTLCGHETRYTDTDKHRWCTWRTCEDCWNAAHAVLDKLAGKTPGAAK